MKAIESQEFGTLYVPDDSKAAGGGTGASPTPQPSTIQSSPNNSLTGNNHNNGPNGLGVSLSERRNQGGGAMGSPTQNAGGAMTQTPPDNMTAFRQGIIDRGIDNDRIGWNESNGNVTLDGKDVFKPEVNIDGTTYADTATINRIANKAYEASGDKLYAARQYINSLGIGDIVDWDNETGMVNIGGVTIKPAYVSDGIAYVPKSQLDAAANEYKRQTGVNTPQSVVDRYDERWDEPTRKVLDSILNRQGFTYDPDTDPFYQQYAAEREREADLNFRKTLNANNTSVFGASGAVLSEAAAQRANALRDIAEAQRVYRNDAYGRYVDDYDMRRQALNSLMGVSGADFEREYGANDDAYERAFKDRQYYDDRIDTAWEQDQTARTNDLLREGYGIGNRSTAAQADVNRMYADRYPEILDSEVTSGRINNATAGFDYILNKGTAMGYLTKWDAALVPELLELYSYGTDGKLRREDGTIVNPQEAALDYLARELTVQNDAARGKAYNQTLGRLDAKAGR